MTGFAHFQQQITEIFSNKLTAILGNKLTTILVNKLTGGGVGLDAGKSLTCGVSPGMRVKGYGYGTPITVPPYPMGMEFSC